MSSISSTVTTRLSPSRGAIEGLPGGERYYCFYAMKCLAGGAWKRNKCTEIEHVRHEMNKISAFQKQNGEEK